MLMPKKHTQENPTHPNALHNISPIMDGYEFPVGKYAWNCGETQCVIPGIMIFSTSVNTVLQFSPFTGASGGTNSYR